MTLPNDFRQPGIIQQRIPQFPPVPLPLTGNEIIWVVQNGRSYKAFLSQLAGFSENDWQFIDQTVFAASGIRYAADTSGGSFTLQLPASPVEGNSIEVADPNGAWPTNNLTLGRNGSTIETLAEDMLMDLGRARVVVSYDGTTWRVFAG